jgi:FkbM family methyltransferase
MYKNISLADNVLIYLRKPLDFISTYKVLFTVSNWYDVLLFRAGIKKRVVLRPKGGIERGIRSRKEFVEFFNENPLISQAAVRRLRIKKERDGVTFVFGGRRLRLYAGSALQQGNAVRLIRENFSDEQYRMLNVKGKVVVDIGANVGDTAMYFALKGAKHVYAFEPFPYSYGLLCKNIKANGFEGLITPVNEGCGGRPSYLDIPEDYESHGSSELKSFRKGRKVKVSSLSDVVERFRIKDAVLKMDCEGCEYGIVLDSDGKTLGSFSEMAIEAHHGYLNLERKLRASGFTVERSVPKLPINVRTESNNMLLNVLHCVRGAGSDMP